MLDVSIPPVADRRAWHGLFAVLPLVLIVAMDGSILYLAMPHLTSALRPSAEQALWILDIYGFVVGSLLIAFGTIGDRYGRLKLIMVGAVIFGAGSLGAAYAETPAMLIACRALMGLGGATLLPSSLAILSALFADPRARAQAIGIFAATFAAGFAVGPVIGGLLLARFQWGSVFLINVPVVAVFLLAAPVLLRDVKATRYGRIDLPSLALSIAGLFAVIWSVKEAAAQGFSLPQGLAGVAGAALLALFLGRQERIAYPLLDLGLFRDRVFSIAILTGLLPLVVWSATGYLTGIYLQSVLGFAVLPAALLTLPGALVLTATCVWTPRIVARIGRRSTLIAIYGLIAAGLLLLLFARTDTGVALVIASSMVASLGYGLSFSLVADVAVSAVPSERAGAAGAIAETSNELGNALGISLLGSLAALVYRLEGPNIAGTLDETLDRKDLAVETALQAQEAFLAGLQAAAGVGALIMLAAGIAAYVLLPRKLPE